MCLITERTEKYIAEEDLTVYKLFRRKDYNKFGELISFFQYFKYTPDVVYTEDLEEGSMHEFFDRTSINFYKWLDKKSLISIGKGLHSMTLNRAKNFFYLPIDYLNDPEALICKCIIPKGSIFYKDGTGLFVSNQLIVKEVLAE